LASFLNQEAIISAFSDEVFDPLLVYPKPLERFFQNVFQRDSFVSFLGMNKSGKSQMLLDAAFRGMTQRIKTSL
jgi:hypothetical protein